MAKTKCTHIAKLPEYCLEVVGTDRKQAESIARAIKRGIRRSADICKMRPSVCAANLGLPRNKMPQIASDIPVPCMMAGGASDRARARAIVTTGGKVGSPETVQAQFLAHLKKSGVQIRRRTIPVGKLKATQTEIKASKTFGMADSHLKGNFPGIDKQILVSRDGYILDGHHRWAALLTIDPKRKMSVIEIGLPMDGTGTRSVLAEAAAFPGVYKVSFAGNPLGPNSQKAYKTKSKADLRIAKKKKPVAKVAKDRCARKGRISTKARDKLPDKAFGLPKLRKYPLYKLGGDGKLVPSRTHATNAKARARQGLDKGSLTRSQYASIVRKANLVLKQCGAKPKKAAKKAPSTAKKGGKTLRQLWDSVRSR